MTIIAGPKAPPSRAWYPVAALVAAAGIGVAVWLFASTLSGLLTGIDRFDSGETKVVRLETDGDRAIYERTDLGAVGPANCSVPGVRLRGNENTTLTLGSDEFRSIFALEGVPVDGNYAVRCVGPPGSRFAVGPELQVGSLLVTVLLIIASAGLGILGGATIAVVTAVLRRRDVHGRA